MQFKRQKILDHNSEIENDAPRLFHFDRHWMGEQSRVHLRVDGDGSGILLVNASRVMHLNPTAVLMAKLILEDTPQGQAIRQIRRHYRVSQHQAQVDYTQFEDKLDQLLRPDGACPVHDLDLEISAPFSLRPSAPYRMDLALTYRCNHDCSHCYNARERDYQNCLWMNGSASWIAPGKWVFLMWFLQAVSLACARICRS